MDWSDGLRRLVAILVALVVVFIIGAVTIGAVAAAKSDNDRRVAVAEACATIHSETLRSECIREVGQ